MMATVLTELHIHQLRNMLSVQIPLHPRFNLFHGQNGSGKTTLLEAIYVLATGHSFRTRETTPLIRSGEHNFVVFARAGENSVSIQKSRSGNTVVKLNQQPCKRASDLAYFLPCQLIYHDLFSIIDAGPSVRRGLLDWGLFHVEQSYHGLLKDYRHVLKQRNALLRQKVNYQECYPWDKQLVEIAHALDELRANYFQTWFVEFQTVLISLTDVPCGISYEKGWDKKRTGKSLADILRDQFEYDLQQQFTHSGPHQADLVFETAVSKAKHHLSRGQQKIILIALKLAQAHLLAKPCVYLFDDMTAELDDVHVQRLFDCLSKVKGQFFLTTTTPLQFVKYPQVSSGHCFSLKDGQIYLDNSH